MKPCCTSAPTFCLLQPLHNNQQLLRGVRLANDFNGKGKTKTGTALPHQWRIDKALHLVRGDHIPHCRRRSSQKSNGLTEGVQWRPTKLGICHQENRHSQHTQQERCCWSKTSLPPIATHCTAGVLRGPSAFAGTAGRCQEHICGEERGGSLQAEFSKEVLDDKDELPAAPPLSATAAAMAQQRRHHSEQRFLSSHDRTGGEETQQQLVAA